MKRFSTEFKVGLFILASLAVITYIGIRFGTFKFGDRYTVHVTFPHAQGVVALGGVQIAGVPVGRVESVRYVKGGARMDLAINHEVDLHRDATATIRPKSLLGEKVVELTPGSPDQPLLADGSELTNILASTDISELLNQAGRMFAQLSPAMSEFADGLSKMGTLIGGGKKGANVTATLEDASVLIHRFRVFFETHERDISRTLEDLSKTSATLRELTGDEKESLRSMVKNGKEITDKLNGILDKVSDPDTEKRVKSLMDKLEKTLDKLSKSWLL